MLTVQNGIVIAEPPKGRIRVGLGGFLLLAFILSWVGAAPMVLGSWIDADSSGRLREIVGMLQPLQLLMTFGTLIAALVVALLNYGYRGVRDLIGALFKFRVSPLWYVFALAAPAAAFIGGSFLARRFDASLPPFAFDMTMVAASAQIFALYLIVNTEEIAWRGYALPQMQRSMAPLKANLLLALIWGAFHTPLFLMKGGHPAGFSIALFAVMVMSIGLVAGWAFNATRGSVLITHLLHQSLNAWSEGVRVFPVMNEGSPWPMRISVALVAAAGLVAAIMLALKKRPSPQTD